MSIQLHVRVILGVLALALTATIPGLGSALKDARRQPITRAVLTQDIQRLPLSSPTQFRDLLRASHSGLLDVAYAQYTQAWERQSQDPNANVLRGLAAELYWEVSMDPVLRKPYGLNASRGDLFIVAEGCLNRAAVLAPRSAEATMEDGYFLWQFGDQEAQGLALLKKASRLAPDDPRVHATLGLVYSNQSGNAYSLPRAVAELERAVRLDPSYAYPHQMLADIYQWQGQTALSQEQRRVALSLLP